MSKGQQPSQSLKKVKASNGIRKRSNKLEIKPKVKTAVDLQMTPLPIQYNDHQLSKQTPFEMNFKSSLMDMKVTPGFENLMLDSKDRKLLLKQDTLVDLMGDVSKLSSEKRQRKVSLEIYRKVTANSLNTNLDTVENQVGPTPINQLLGENQIRSGITDRLVMSENSFGLEIQDQRNQDLFCRESFSQDNHSCCFDIYYSFQKNQKFKETILNSNQNLFKYHSQRQDIIHKIHNICNDQNFSRCTFYNTVYCLDRLLTHEINDNILKIASLSILHFVTKNEEPRPISLRYILRQTQDQTSIDQLEMLELKILKKINFQISCPHLYDFLDFFMHSWDHQLKAFSSDYHQELKYKKVYFKQDDPYSYRMFQQTMMIADACLYFVDTHYHNDMLLALSILYLMIKIYLGETDITRVSKIKSIISQEFSKFEIFFERFIQTHDQSLQLYDLEISFRYICKFFNVKLALTEVVIKEAKFRTKEEFFAVTFRQDDFEEAISDIDEILTNQR